MAGAGDAEPGVDAGAAGCIDVAVDDDAAAHVEVRQAGQLDISRDVGVADVADAVAIAFHRVRP